MAMKVFRFNPAHTDKQRKHVATHRQFLTAFQMTQTFENIIEQQENPSKAATVSESLFERKIPGLSLGCQEIEVYAHTQPSIKRK